ncbi:MAG TPA: CGNR zinc finger domain-containing protein [Acidimicrobiia bacterium]|nr:CGNR zinc finger domain-containing protein [Acidimicrobiia bacterium]
MDFSHYTTKPVELAVALANTEGITHDDLSDPGEMVEFLDEYRDLWDGVAKPPKKNELEAVRLLRSALREVIESGDEKVASERVNALLESYGATPRLSTHNGTPHLHFEPTETSIVCWLGAVTAMGLASVIIEHGVDRFGVCDSGTCQDVYVDTSRNRSRRHCSNTCSTREAVAAYRKRQADD